MNVLKGFTSDLYDVDAQNVVELQLRAISEEEERMSQIRKATASDLVKLFRNERYLRLLKQSYLEDIERLVVEERILSAILSAFNNTAGVRTLNYVCYAAEGHDTEEFEHGYYTNTAFEAGETLSYALDCIFDGEQEEYGYDEFISLQLPLKFESDEGFGYRCFRLSHTEQDLQYEDWRFYDEYCVYEEYLPIIQSWHNFFVENRTEFAREIESYWKNNQHGR